MENEAVSNIGSLIAMTEGDTRENALSWQLYMHYLVTTYIFQVNEAVFSDHPVSSSIKAIQEDGRGLRDTLRNFEKLLDLPVMKLWNEGFLETDFSEGEE